MISAFSSPIAGEGSRALSRVPLKANVPEMPMGPARGGSGISDLLQEVNSSQTAAEDASLRLARGESRNVHEALISMEKAQLSLQFTLQVRNKVIEAYQEIMRMQI